MAGEEYDTNTELAFIRTYLAAERTHLAWMRTILSILGFTMVLLKLFDPQKHKLSHHKGLFVFIATTSVALLVYSTYRYFLTLELIRQIKFDPDEIGIAAVSLAMLCLGCLTYYLMRPKVDVLVDQTTEDSSSYNGPQPEVERKSTGQVQEENLNAGLMANMMMDFD